ncbi:MAG: tetratricopeptide repeat protein, partial [Calothrix sp. SM1_7_51]|nr:tetratricopeptide repeat protein [Calothrix sp. SM1_7_51]
MQSNPDSAVKATALRSLGDVLQLIGELERSLKTLEQSLSVSTRLKSPQETSATLLSLGNVTLALANQENSEPDNTHALQSTPLRCINRPADKNAIKFYQQAAQYYIEAAKTSVSPLTQIKARVNHFSIL